jgi:hypothetical protein
MIPMPLHKEYFTTVKKEYYTSCDGSVGVLKLHCTVQRVASNTKSALHTFQSRKVPLTLQEINHYITNNLKEVKKLLFYKRYRNRHMPTHASEWPYGSVVPVLLAKKTLP